MAKKGKQYRHRRRKQKRLLLSTRICNVFKFTIGGLLICLLICLNNMQRFYNSDYDVDNEKDNFTKKLSSKITKDRPFKTHERQHTSDALPPSSQCTLLSISEKQAFQFYPKRFFEHGPGREFLPLLKHTMDNFTDILNARFLVYNYTASCSLVYFHIHKNGGTTMERHVPLSVDNFYSKREKELGHEKFESVSRSVMNNVYLLQQQTSNLQAEQNVNAFTFLRDPVDRFLSSLAQVLKLRTWHKRLYPCYNYNSTNELVDCVLTKMENGTFLDMHLTPQSFELYKEIMDFDIRINLMDISEIDDVLFTLGAGNVRKERSVTGSIIRRFPQFRLTKDILTPEFEKRICAIYKSDVLMMKHTGVTSTRCFHQQSVNTHQTSIVEEDPR